MLQIFLIGWLPVAMASRCGVLPTQECELDMHQNDINASIDLHHILRANSQFASILHTSLLQASLRPVALWQSPLIVGSVIFTLKEHGQQN